MSEESLWNGCAAVVAYSRVVSRDGSWPMSLMCPTKCPYNELSPLAAQLAAHQQLTPAWQVSITVIARGYVLDSTYSIQDGSVPIKTLWR